MSKRDFIAGYIAGSKSAHWWLEGNCATAEEGKAEVERVMSEYFGQTITGKTATIAPRASIEDAMDDFSTWFIDNEGRVPNWDYETTKVFLWLASCGILTL